MTAPVPPRTPFPGPTSGPTPVRPKTLPRPSAAPAPAAPVPSPVPAEPPTGRRAWRWWIALAVLACTFAVYSLSVGQFLVEMREPEHLGHSTVGEWADLSDYGYRLRFEGFALHDSMPSSWDATRLEYPPDGMQYVEARFTVEVLVGEEEDMGCTFKLFNADDEELGLTGIGLGDVEGTECQHSEQRAGLVPGDTFASHQVYVVPSGMDDGFTLRAEPFYLDEDQDNAYWTFGE
ncbi:hypothetical protein GCM10028820_13160 [Tessaracoccus terricola]